MSRAVDNMGNVTTQTAADSSTVTTPATVGEPFPVTTHTTTTTNYNGSTTNTTTNQTTYNTSYANQTNNQTQPNTNPASSVPALTDCDKFPLSMGCSDFGDVTDTPLVDKPINVSSITPFNLGGMAYCPADIQLSNGLKWKWKPYCDFASMARPIVLAFAWLSAAFILMGFRQDNA